MLTITTGYENVLLLAIKSTFLFLLHIKMRCFKLQLVQNLLPRHSEAMFFPSEREREKKRKAERERERERETHTQSTSLRSSTLSLSDTK